MENPGSWVVSGEADGNVVTCDTSRNDVPTNRVLVVVNRASSTANDSELMLCWISI
jgi:hypothetical protein